MNDKGEGFYVKPQYVSIKELAVILGISEISARYLAKSRRLRSIKGAVIDVNARKGKYEILKINLRDAIEVYGVT